MDMIIRRRDITEIKLSRDNIKDIELLRDVIKRFPAWQLKRQKNILLLTVTDHIDRRTTKHSKRRFFNELEEFLTKRTIEYSKSYEETRTIIKINLAEKPNIRHSEPEEIPNEDIEDIKNHFRDNLNCYWIERTEL